MRIKGRLLQLDQLVAPQQRCGRPIVKQHRLATANRRSNLGIQGCARTAAKIGVAVRQAIGFELLRVDYFRGPADGTVEEATLVRGLWIFKDVLVARQVSHTLEVWRQGLDTPCLVALDHIFRYPPAFGGAGNDIAQPLDLALCLGLDPHRAAPRPFFTNHLNIVFGKSGFQGDGSAGQSISRQLITLLDDHPQDLGNQATAFPVQVSKMHRRGRLGRRVYTPGNQCAGQQRT